MQTPPQSPPRRQAPGAPRQQRRGMRTPVRQRIQRRVPGAPQRQRQAPREDGDESRRNDEENKKRQEEFERRIRVADDEESDTPLHRDPQNDGLIVNNLKF